MACTLENIGRHSRATVINLLKIMIVGDVERIFRTVLINEKVDIIDILTSNKKHYRWHMRRCKCFVVPAILDHSLECL